MPLRLLLLLLLATVAWAGDPRDMDRILMKQGPSRFGLVVAEKVEHVEYRLPPNTEVLKLPWSQVREVQYKGMTADGFFKTGMEDKIAGGYAIAAQRFRSLASQATYEWERAYGWWHCGDCLELAGNLKEAQEAFMELANALPEHRLAADALYRAGVAAALLKDPAVGKVIEQLSALSSKSSSRGPKMRADAITAIVEAVKGNLPSAKNSANLVSFHDRNEPEAWQHWNITWASMLRRAQDWPEATRFYQRMLSAAGDDQVVSITARLGLAECLDKGGSAEQALLEYVRIDVMPYGSPQQRLEAQFQIGSLFYETAKNSSSKERSKEFAQEKIALARKYLQAVASAPLDSPLKAKAEAVLSSLPAEAPPPKPAAAEGEPPAKAPAGGQATAPK